MNYFLWPLGYRGSHGCRIAVTECHLELKRFFFFGNSELLKGSMFNSGCKGFSLTRIMNLLELLRSDQSRGLSDGLRKLKHTTGTS